MKNFSEFLNDLTGRMGQGTLADQLGIDGSTLSRFRSNQGSLPISTIDRIIEFGQACILPCEERNRLENALETISELWRQERNRNRNERS